MKRFNWILASFSLLLVVASCQQTTEDPNPSSEEETTSDYLFEAGEAQAKIYQDEFPEGHSELDHQYEGEVHLKNIRQLTFGGDNAEAYWSFAGDKLIFQRTNENDGFGCDQIFIGDIPGEGEDFTFNMVSTGGGRTTCSYFLPDDQTVLYASTHERHDGCPPVPESGHSYVWPLYPEFEIYRSDLDGNIVQQYTDNDYYDAEATVFTNRR